jgi:hypothetical protein
MSGPLDAVFVLGGIALLGLMEQRTSQETAWAGRMAAARPAVRKKRPAPRAASDMPRASTARPDAKKTSSEPATPPPIPESERYAEPFAEVTEEIEVRSRALAEDDQMQGHCGSEITAWEMRRALHASRAPSAEAVAEGKDLVADADRIVAKSFEIAEQQRKREYVLKAIVESLHAVGYFTDEPIWPSDADRGGPITLTARRADEQVTISLPLGEDVVRSNWQGFAGEACAESFMEYVAAMDERGVTCTSCNQLGDRPRLRAAGRKDLPREETRGH